MTIRKLLGILAATCVLLAGLAVSAMAQNGNVPGDAAEFDSGQPYDDKVGGVSTTTSTSRSVLTGIKEGNKPSADKAKDVKKPSNKNMIIIHGD